MTRFGALPKEEKDKILDYGCQCDMCKRFNDILEIFTDPAKLAAHNLFVILDTIQRLRMARDNNEMENFLDTILKTHAQWFPNSLLNQSWEENYSHGK